MTQHQWLLRAFDYDAWANDQWARQLTRFKDSARAIAIFQHILTAQRIWLERCGVVFEFDKTDEDLGHVAKRIAQVWRLYLDDADLDQEVIYVNSVGAQYMNTVEQIALHVINHGTYHRGHLRGLAECEGLDDFNDTDLVLYFREN